METEFIEIKGLEVRTFIGVPDEERALAQSLWVDLKMTSVVPFSECGDDVGRTIDYAAVANGIEQLALAKPRRLIETLAEEIKLLVLGEFGAEEVWVRIRKRILPNARWVAVSTTGRSEKKSLSQTRSGG